MNEALEIPTGTACHACGQEAKIEAYNVELRRRLRNAMPEAWLCVACVQTLLARYSIALHGDIGSKPYSSDHAGHENRLCNHERRVAREEE